MSTMSQANLPEVPGRSPKQTGEMKAGVPGPRKASLLNSPTWHKLKWPLAALILVLLYNFFYTPGFFQVEMKDGRLFGSLIDVLNRAAPVMILSLGMTLVIATGGVDLSVGAVMAISGSVAALLIV